MKKSIISLLVVIVMLLGIILGMTNTVLAETPTTKTYTIISSNIKIRRGAKSEC